MNRAFLFSIILAAVAFQFATVSAQPSKGADIAGQPARAGTDARPDAPQIARERVGSRSEFDALARVYSDGVPYALPHVMFVIDRAARDKIYYVDTNRYRFHKDFLLANYLVPRGADVFKPIYIDEDRRFIVGTIAWQKPVERFTWEMWEGDLATAEHIRLAHELINRTFFAPVAYKPNSSRQDDVSAALKIDRVSQSEINKNQEYLPLNTGSAVGRIHIIDKLDDTVEIGDNEIVVLKELPMSLPPVRGIIVAKPSSPLSHVNILARGWGIPNVYIKDADKLLREYDTFVYRLDAGPASYKLERASLEEIKEKFASPDEQVPPVNLKVTRLAGLREMRRTDSIIYGSKAANLGEMLNARIPGMTVPDGFSIPFYWYDRFVRDNGIDKVIDEMTSDYNFVHNPRVRRQRLEELRAMFQNGRFDARLRAHVLTRWRVQLRGRTVFVRSSSSSEDLPNFSGAGLYSSVANVRQADKLIDAIKKVWGSLWKFEAYEARVRNYVSQSDVYMSALIQLGVDMQKGGVMITRDPFDASKTDSVYISAVCGHNSRVVDNAGIPEQVLFKTDSNSVVVKTLSQQENALAFDPRGDLRTTADKCANAQGRVLTDTEVRSLARVATRIKQAFGGEQPQDIEWGILNGRIYIVQSRPYIDKR
ncbi:MAG: PEP/pyruvate-binding domain-containing protein [Pyrinomonadaceae bacterium]